MKKFEVIRKSNGSILANISNIADMPCAELVQELSDVEFAFKIDYKLKTQQQVLNFLDKHSEEIIAAKSEKLKNKSDDDIMISKVSQLYPTTVRDYDVPSEGVIVLYTRYMEDGRFKSTYTQMKTFDKVEDAQAFIDKKLGKQSKYVVGLDLIIDGVHQGTINLVNC